MAKFAVAFRDRELAERIASLLREGGYEVIRVCCSADEVKRTFRTVQDGILISGCRLKDRMIDSLAEDLNEHVEVLCLARADQLDQIQNANIFRQSLPLSRQVLFAWADMLVQLHYQKLPHRRQSDLDVINQAKQTVMDERHMSESEAHRYLQQLSMRLGIRMAMVAERILSHEDFE